MYAVIQTGGKQYRVAPGDEIRIEKLAGEVGDTVSFDKVLLLSDEDRVEAGKPFLENTTVSGRICGHGKEKKIIVFKYKRRKGYKKKQGHRQQYTLIKVEDIAKQ